MGIRVPLESQSSLLELFDALDWVVLPPRPLTFTAFEFVRIGMAATVPFPVQYSSYAVPKTFLISPPSSVNLPSPKGSGCHGHSLVAVRVSRPGFLSISFSGCHPRVELASRYVADRAAG